jgi:hypothetical protein
MATGHTGSKQLETCRRHLIRTSTKSQGNVVQLKLRVKIHVHVHVGWEGGLIIEHQQGQKNKDRIKYKSVSKTRKGHNEHKLYLSYRGGCLSGQAGIGARVFHPRMGRDLFGREYVSKSRVSCHSAEQMLMLDHDNQMPSLLVHARMLDSSPIYMYPKSYSYPAPLRTGKG